ncbi:acyltransferase family protein [Thermomonospora umbrina]|uniref:Acyltransferase-like protein n=1 Tax=Thermomonospora umbrina TaxID=111806 RepID=A0A3D9SR48_9ACTN|nr:acyltransferase [Thermomonospora umbrina]REE95415.1 acyltransferase-like protein [Thermomonospora umbrina]
MPSPATLVDRINASTPPERDRTVDALRAIGILGVILGHWLVTAVVMDSGQPAVASPLTAMPWLAPVSWVFQTLAVFFLVGGYVGAKGYRPGTPYAAWVRTRMSRLFRPVPVLLLAWVPVAAGLLCVGYTGESLRSVIKLVLSPLWFLVVYAALTALTPLVVALWRRLGWSAAALAVGTVALVDLARFGLDGPDALGWINVVVGWLVPYLLGVAWAHGAMNGRRVPAAMLGGGALATAGLIVYAGYPASMVGVPGAEISNLNPPTLAAVTFGVAQVGLALLLRDRLARLMRRPRWWAATAMANLSAMTVFLWHQTAMLAVTLTAALAGTAGGLHTRPETLSWGLQRLVWLPAFAAALALAWAVAHRFERPRRPRR